MSQTRRDLCVARTEDETFPPWHTGTTPQPSSASFSSPSPEATASPAIYFDRATWRSDRLAPFELIWNRTIWPETTRGRIAPAAREHRGAGRARCPPRLGEARRRDLGPGGGGDFCRSRSTGGGFRRRPLGIGVSRPALPCGPHAASEIVVCYCGFGSRKMPLSGVSPSQTMLVDAGAVTERISAV